MKKLILLLFIPLILLSCKKVKDIEVSEIETACQAVDAYLKIAKRGVLLYKSINSSKGKPALKKINEYKILREKGEQLEGLLESGNFTESEIKNCKNFEKLDKIFDENPKALNGFS